MSETEMTGGSPPKNAGAGSGRCPKWVRVALFLSVALNLLVVGAIAGAVMHNDGRHGRPATLHGNLDASVRPFAQALTAQQRKAVGEALRENGPRVQAGAGAVRARLEEMLAVLRADEFSAEAFSDSIMAARAGLNEQQDLAFGAMIAQISAMDMEERMEFADRLERSFRRTPPRRR